MPKGIALTAKDVDMIWNDLAKPGADKREIATKYGLNVRQIYGMDKARRDGTKQWKMPASRICGHKVS